MAKALWNQIENNLHNVKGMTTRDASFKMQELTGKNIIFETAHLGKNTSSIEEIAIMQLTEAGQYRKTGAFARVYRTNGDDFVVV